jgi:hypothetical protein
MRKAAEARRVAPILTDGDPGACFPIGVVADLLGVTEQTLRLYESHGLVKPARRNRERYYCAGDIQWVECLRHLIHTEKVSIEGVKRLLHFAPCWEIIGPPREMQCSACPVFREHSGGPVVNGGCGGTRQPSDETIRAASRAR